MKPLRGLTSAGIVVALSMPQLQGIDPGRASGGRPGIAALRTIPALIVLLLGVPALAEPAETQTPVGDLPAGAGGPRPSATLPGPPRALPETIPFPAFTRSAELAVARPLAGDPTLLRSSAITPRLAGSFEAGGFAGRLLSRMEREAQRYRRENVSLVSSAAAPRSFDEVDSIAFDRQSEQAERIVTRSARRTLDLELERLARRSLGLGATLDFFGRVSAQGVHHEAPATQRMSGGDAAAARQKIGRPDRVTGGIGLRLDAHPALVLRTTLFGIQGRLDVPARNEPYRLSIDSPAGPRGRAVLTSGRARDGRGWATLTFNFRF